MKSFLRFLKIYGLYVVLTLIVIAFLLMYVDPSQLIPEKKDYVLIDHCGQLPSGLGVEHTIPDKSGCEVQCFGKCNSVDLSMKSVEFEVLGAGLCHTCLCTCS